MELTDSYEGRGPAPSDEEAGAAWDEIMRLARDHALIVQAFGGVATLATPAAQREAGIRNQILRTHRLHLER